MVDNDSIKSFIMMAEVGSLTEAAERLYLSPSSLTSRIKKIEKEIGEELFVLSGRTLTLSQAGKVFLSYAKQFSAIQDELNDRMDSFQEEKQRFRLAATPSISTYILPTILKEFFNYYPDVELKILSCQSHLMRELLFKDEIDLGISQSGSKYDFLNYQKWFSDRDIMVVSSTHPWASKKEIEIEELRDHPLLAYQRHSLLWKNRLQWIKDRGVNPWIGMELPHIETIKDILLNNYGYAFLPIHGVRDLLAENKLTEVHIKDSPNWKRDTTFVMNKKHPITKIYNDFIDLAFEKEINQLSQKEGKLIS